MFIFILEGKYIISTGSTFFFKIIFEDGLHVVFVDTKLNYYCNTTNCYQSFFALIFSKKIKRTEILTHVHAAHSAF